MCIRDRRRRLPRTAAGRSSRSTIGRIARSIYPTRSAGRSRRWRAATSDDCLIRCVPLYLESRFTLFNSGGPMPLGLGFGEMVLIFAVLLLLFGAKRLPELASGMGKGIRDFKRSLNGMDEDSVQASIAKA